ncbi:MAG: DUF1844 domain-containing protein [Chthoniobacterales bacterium]
MAEIQTNTQSGEMTQRFIEFVMMQAQNAALFLGQIPNPQTGQGEVNLEVAKMFIDQLAMIQEKTRGNLSDEESSVIKNTLANLQMAFVEVSRSGPGGKSGAAPAAPAGEVDSPAPIAVDTTPKETEAPSTPAPPAEEAESRKKFTKSYGA